MFNINLPPQIQDFITIFLGILVEAIPFVILGSIVSAIISTFIKDKWILRFLPKNRFLSHFVMPFIGVVFPVCECGNVPVARRLFFKGLKSSQVITFLLAAPAFNPIVYLSTYAAFKTNSPDMDLILFHIPQAVFLRFFLTYIIAVGIGLLIYFIKNEEDILNKKFSDEVACYVEHDHGKFKNFVNTIINDFGIMIFSLTLGAFIASTLQTFAPVNVLTTLGQNPILSILTMMLIAFVISICSNVDAFVALSYNSRFTSGSIISFLVFGPMIDIKSLSMMSQIFNKRILFLITFLVTSLVFLSSIILNYYFL